MPITPTSTLSKNYQALGIDEIANDIETAFTTINATDDALVVLTSQVNAIPGADATTVEVNISSAQILAMGSTSIELLPAAGVGNYYDVERVILEYTHVTTAYTLTDDFYLYHDIDLGVIGGLISSPTDKYCFIQGNGSYIQNGIVVGYNSSVVGGPGLNALELTTYNGTNPTLGDGTMRAIVTYTVRTFGA